MKFLILVLMVFVSVAQAQEYKGPMFNAYTNSNERVGYPVDQNGVQANNLKKDGNEVAPTCPYCNKYESLPGVTEGNGEETVVKDSSSSGTGSSESMGQ